MKTLLEQMQNEDWKSNVAAGLLGATLAASPAMAGTHNNHHSSKHISQPAKVASLNKGNLSSVDKKLYDVVWAEANGNEAEVKATASVYLNRTMMKDYNSALKGSSAHNKGSLQYQKAKNGPLSKEENAELLQLDIKRKNKQATKQELARLKELQNSGLSDYEMKQYNNQKKIIDGLISNPSTILPYDHHENTEAYGSPDWAKDMVGSVNIGKQKYYTSLALSKALRKS